MQKWLKDNIGVVLILVLSAVPVIFWLFMKPLSARFISQSIGFRSLGQLTGLLGMALLSINFILSARFKFLDKWFNGLNRVYIKHHTIGIIAFCLLLFHPTFLIVQYLFISLKSTFSYFFSFRDWAINFGEISLLVFIVLMVITIYLNFKYQNWKNTHKYLGLVLFFGILHMLLVTSDVSNNIYLKSYMILLASLGVISYLYRTILKIYKKGEYKYKLKEVIKINENVIELKMTPFSQKMRFIPGQFIFVRFANSSGNEDVLSESHPFSISSASEESGDISLGIKALGDYTSMVYLLKLGATCIIEGPFGVFSFMKSKAKRQIWIAGGIGITPFLGMARQLNSVKTKTDMPEVDLYYSVKNENEAAFADELAQISGQNPNFKFSQHFSDKDGYILADKILINKNNVSECEIFLCGPASFMKSLREQFLRSGFKNGQIHSEEFNLSV